MATTDVDTAEATPLTTLQKMEVEDKELVTGESDKSVDQLSKDELNKIEVDLTKVLETVERSGGGEDTEAVQVQSDVGVRACDAGAQESGGVAEGGVFVRTPSVPEVADEKTFTKSHVDVEPSDHLLHLESLKEVETQGRVNNSGDESKQEEDADKEIASLSEKADGKEFSCESEKEVGVSAGQVQEDAVVDVEKELEKSPETKAGEVSMLERQAEVCTELESVPTVSTEDCQEVTKGSDEDHSASKTDDDDTEREKPVHVSENRETATSTDSLKEEGVGDELPSATAQPEEKTTDSVQVEEKHIIGEISKTDEEPEQAISLKDDPVVEKLEISSENISEETGEADPSDIAEKTIPHVEEEKTIIEQQTDDSETNANERRASDDTSLELEKSQVSVTTRTCPAEDVETEKADSALVTEEASDLEAGVQAVEDSREVDVASADSFTTGVDDKSPDAKTEEASSPSSNTEHLLQQEESKPAKTDKIVQQVNEEPTSTCADDDRVKEQTNIVGHKLTGSHGEDVMAPLDDKEENSNKKEISEQVIQEFSKLEEEPEESTHKPEIGTPETSPNSTSEEPGEAVESDHVDGITITTTGEETDKIEGQGTDSTEFKMNSALAEAKGKTEVAEAEILGEDAETNKEEKTEFVEKDGVNKASHTVTVDDSGPELPSPAERDLKETSKDEDSDQPEQINETPEILERVTVEKPAEIKEGAPGKDEDIPVSISEDETVKKVEQIEERHKEHPANDCETETVGDTGADVSDTTEDEVVTIKEQGSAGSTEVKSGTATDQHLQEEEKQHPIEPIAELVEKEAELTGDFEERVAGNGTQLDEPIALESQMQTHGIEEVPARVEQIAETLSQEQTENKVESKPESVSEPNLDDSNSQEKVSEPDPDDSEKLTKTSEPDPDDAENPKQVSEPKPDDSENLKKTFEPDPDDAEDPEQVSEPKPDDSEKLKKTSEPDPDDAENPKQVSEPKPDDSENLKKTSEPDPDDAENPKQVSEPKPDDSENLKKTSEPDPDDAENLKQVSEPKPDDSENLKKTSEPDPDDAENPKQVSEPKPDDSENLKKTSEPDLDDAENPKQVSEPDPDDCENLEKVLEKVQDDFEELKQVAEPDPDDSETLKQVSEPDPDNSGSKEKVSEPDPDVSENLEKVSEPDPDDSEKVKKISGPDPDDSQNQKFVPEADPDDSENQEKVDTTEISEDCDEATKKEIPVSPSEEVPEKTDATPGEATFSEVSTVGGADKRVSRSIEVITATDIVPELSVEYSVQEEDHSYQIPETGNEEHKQESAPTPTTDDQTTHEQIIKGDAEQDEEPAIEETVSTVQQNEAQEEIQTREATEEQVTEEIEDTGGSSAAAGVTVEGIKPDEAEEEMEKIEDSAASSAEQDDAEIPVTAADRSESHAEEVKEQITEEVCQKDEPAEEASVQENKPGEPSASSVNDDEVTILNTKEAPEDPELSGPSLNDDNITSQKSDEGAEEIQEEEEKVDVSDRETAKEVLVPEEEQKDTNAANETEDSEPTSVNNDNITSLKSEKNTEETQEEQEKVDVSDKETAKGVLVLEDEQKHAHVPNETEDTEASASSVNEDNITSQKTEKNTEETQEEQEKVDVSDKETAKEVLVPEEEQKDTNVPNETEDTEATATIVTGDNITSQKSEQSTEEIQEEQQKDDANAEDKETVKEKLVPEDEQKDTNVPNETEDTEPSASSVNDDNIASQESEERADENLEEQQKDDVSAENKETAKEALVPEDEQDLNVPNETEDTEASASSVNEDNITSQKTEKNTEETQEEQEKVNVSDKETVKEVLEPEDEQKDLHVPNETEDTEASATIVTGDNITSQKGEQSTEEIQEEQQKDDTNAEEKETAKKILVPEDEQKDTSVANETEDTEPSALSLNDDNITSQKSEKNTAEIQAEKDKVDDMETAKEVLVPEDEQKDANVPNEIEDTEASATSVNEDYITSQKSEESTKEIPEEQQKDDVSAEHRETLEVLVPEDEQKDTNAANETEDAEPSSSSVNDDNLTSLKREESTEEILGEQQKDDVIAEEKETADLVPEDKQKDTNVPNEAEDTEPSDSSVNDENITSQESEERAVEILGEQQKNDTNAEEKETAKKVLVPEDEQKDLNVPNETEDTEPCASSVDDDRITSQKSEEGTEEIQEEKQKDGTNAEEKETAKEMLVPEDEQKNTNAANETEDTEPCASSVDDDNITSQKSEEITEEIQEEQQRDDIKPAETETAKDVLVLEDEQNTNVPDEAEHTEPSDKITSLKSEESMEDTLEEQLKDDASAEDKETVKEKLVPEDEQKDTNVPNETEDTEPSASSVNDDNIASQESEERAEENLEEQQKDDVSAENKETAKEVLVPEDEQKDLNVPNETEDTEASASSVNDDRITSLKRVESTEEIQEEKQKDGTNAEEKETAKEMLVPEDEQKDTNAANETEDTEPCASSVDDDNITSQKSEEITEEIQEEQQRDDVKPTETETAKDVLVLEDEQDTNVPDEAEHTEPSDKIISLKNEESMEDTLEEQQKNGVSAKGKETVVEALVPEDEQMDKYVSNDTEDAEQPALSVNDGEPSLDKGEEHPGEVLEKEIDHAKETQTADEVVVRDDDHAQPDQLPNEPKGNQPSLSVNDEDITILKREEVQGEASLENQLADNQTVAENAITKEATVQQGEQGEITKEATVQQGDEEKVHFPNEAEDTGVPASSVDDGDLATLKTEEVQEEGKDKDQAEDNDNVQEREIAPEATEQEVKQEEQLAQLQIETQEAEPSPSSSATIANDDDIDIPKSHSEPETVMETNQVNDDGNAKEVETTKEVLVQESKGVELEHFSEKSDDVDPSIKDESTSVLNSKEEPEEKETDLVRDDMEEKETAHEALRQEAAEPSVADTSDDKTASLKSEGALEEAPEESNQSDHLEPEIEEVKEKDHMDRELVLEDKQGEDAKDEPTASLVNEDDNKTLKSEEVPEEVQEEEKEVKQTEDDGDAKATEAENEALIVDTPREKVIDLAKEMVEAESPAPNPRADETVILKMEEDPEGVEAEDKKKDQVIDDEVYANELPEQEDEKEDKPEHLPSETEGAELHASSVTDDNIIGVDSGEKTEQGAEETVERSQEKVGVTEEKESSNEGLASSVDELEAGNAESKTISESKKPDSVEDNAEKEDSTAEDTSSPGILEDKVESSVRENERIKSVHEEAATTTETQVLDELREAGVEKDIEEETTVPKALAAEAKSTDEDNKGITQTDIHQDDGDTLESVASVEVLNSEAQKDFVTTAKETAEEELESIKPSADEEDKKDLTTTTEAQGEKLQSSEQDEDSVVSDENHDANEPVTTDTDGTILPKSETAEAPAAADEDQVDVTPRGTGDEEPHESPALQEADALGDEDQKELITASDEATENTENESLITSSRECDFQPTDDADEKVDIPSESLKSSSALEEAKSIITGKDTETTLNDKALVESEDKVEDIAVKETQAKEDDETNVKADTSAGSNAAEQAAISSLVLEKDDETQMEIEGDVKSESIKEISSLGLQDATKAATSEVSDESASTAELVRKEEITTKESHSGSTEETTVNEGNNPEHLSSEVPKPEVNAAEAVEIKEELLMEEPSLVTTPPGLAEQEGQEKSVQVVTSVAHKAEPDEEIGTKEQCHDSADEILSAPVKLQEEPEASREPAGVAKVEEVNSTELDKEENKGQSEIQTEAPDSTIPEKLEVKEAQPQETATVTPVNDKLEVDQAIKSEASEDPIELAEKTGGPDPAEIVILSTASRDREADFLDEEVVAHQSKFGTVQADDSVATLAVPKQEQASSEATVRADTDAEASPIPVSTANKGVPAETQQSTTRSLDYAEVARPEIENAGRGVIESESKSAEVEKTKTPQEIDSKTESAILPVNIPAENSLSDLLQISTKDTIQMAQQPSQETDPPPKKDDPRTEDPKTDEDKDDEEEEGEEQKKTDSNSSDGVIVEGSRDLDIKSPQKKHGILSGVGSKVKNSISKVKKAITGKSSHPKP